jgi:tyrosine-protein kinase Etk/Wzc
MEQIPAKEVEYARLKRAPEILTQMVTLLQTRLKEAQIAQAVDEPAMRVVDPAYASTKPVRPKPAVDLAFGILLGLLVGFGAAVTREHLDRSLHTRDDVEAVTGTPVLGLIPRMTNGRAAALPGAAAQLSPSNGRRHLVARSTRQPAARAMMLDPVMEESYTRLHLNVEALQAEGAGRTILLTSPLAGDGKTTTAVNLTRALWQRGYRALLIDADVRRGAVHRTFGTVRTPGLTDILAGDAQLRDAIRNPSLDGRGIHYIPCGSRTSRPAEMLGTDRLAEVLTEAKELFDVIVLDSAPLNVGTDAAVIAPYVDSVILVARAGVTDPEALRFAMEQLRIVRAPVLGTVLNDIDPQRDASYDPTNRYLGLGDYAYFGAGT